MLKKLKVIFLMALVSVCLGLISSTYSRYVADTTGNIEVLFAKWQLLINNQDITDLNNKEVSFIPVINENEHVASNTIAPSSTGYFDIDINPTNVDVSFKYKLNFEILNDNIPDLLISKYTIINEDYVEGDTLEFIRLTNNEIEDTILFKKDIENFKFKPFTIRVFFEWYDGEEKTMTNQEQTLITTNAEDNKFQMKANISFEQTFE